MPKPIVLMYIPRQFVVHDLRSSAEYMMASMNGWDDRIKPREEISEYLWFIFEKQDIDVPEMQVFHSNKFTEVQYEELKALVKDHINAAQMQPIPTLP